ncbi:MAG: Mut7-C RNAse domain-containing protein [Bacteroidales bacterium]
MPLKEAKIRFYEELNDFLDENQTKRDLKLQFYNSPSVKDAIESFGIPHTEVDLILINGESASFDARVRAGDRISVYPKFESFDISGISRLGGRPLRRTKFILDVHLGKLARYLRLCGFDTLYDNQYEDHAIVKISLEENRIILTRDIGILKYAEVMHGYWLRSDQPQKQLQEVIKRFDLKNQVRLFTRCMECNAEIRKVNKNKIRDKLLSGTQKYHNEFFQCSLCHKIYWKGSHYHNMLDFIQKIIYE